MRSGHVARATKSAIGLRTVALFEATKGVLVLVAGCGLLSLAHHGAQDFAEEIVRRFHLNLARHHPRILIDAVTHLSDSRLRLLAGAAILYSAVRFIEAYGLWHLRPWAQWFGIISGAMYLPVEVYELLRHPTAVKAGLFIVNVAVVAYLIAVRWREKAMISLLVITLLAARAVNIF